MLKSAARSRSCSTTRRSGSSGPRGDPGHGPAGSVRCAGARTSLSSRDPAPVAGATPIRAAHLMQSARHVGGPGVKVTESSRPGQLRGRLLRMVNPGHDLGCRGRFRP